MELLQNGELGRSVEELNNMICVYTDGACIYQGTQRARAGIGIYVEEEKIEISERVKGKQTNNVAELTAIIKAIELIIPRLNNNESVCIFTDYKYSMLCCKSYGSKMEEKNFEEDIPNRELVEKIYLLFNWYENLYIKHVKAHTTKQDKHSKGNRKADRLAGMACIN